VVEEMCIWIRKGYVGHHKIGGGMAAPLPHACIGTPP
jgi:hypothetical protein